MPTCIQGSCQVSPIERDFYRPGGVARGQANRAGNRNAPAQAAYESREAAALELKTADGDTVRISFSALEKVRAAVDEGQSASVTAKSRIDVRVSVDGTLDEKEVSQIGDLLEHLVTLARSGGDTAAAGDSLQAGTGGLDAIGSYAFGYEAYQQAALLQ